MRVLLQNAETKLYYIDADEWTDDPSKATDFEEVETAAEVYHTQDLNYARIVVESGLPVSRHQALTELFGSIPPAA